MLGPWLLLVGAAAGALVEVEVGVALAVGLAGLAIVVLRVAPSSLGYALLACGVVAGAHTEEPVPVAALLAPEVPSCRIEGEVGENLGRAGVLVSLDRLECSGAERRGRLGAVFLPDPGGWLGDRVEADGHLVPLRDSEQDRWKARSGADATFAARRVHLFPSVRSSDRAVDLVRTGVSEAAASMGPARGALMEGLTIGETSGMSTEVEMRMRRAGLSHLVAVSGSNVAIVVGAALLVARRLGIYLSVVVASSALALYVAVVGPEPSVLRAAAMGAISLVALASGRVFAPLSALALALAIVLASRPEMVHSVGLQLSAAATLGLILWSAPLADRMSSLPRPVALGLGATIAANLAVAPILVGVFGELSVVSPLANLLALPAVAPATILGLAAGVSTPLSGGLGTLLAAAAEPFVGWILKVGDTLGTPAWVAVKVPGAVGVLLAVPLLVAVGVSLQPKMQRALPVAPTSLDG